MTRDIFSTMLSMCLYLQLTKNIFALLKSNCTIELLRMYFKQLSNLLCHSSFGLVLTFMNIVLCRNSSICSNIFLDWLSVDHSSYPLFLSGDILLDVGGRLPSLPHGCQSLQRGKLPQVLLLVFLG